MKFGLFYQMPCAPDQAEADRYRETIEQIALADDLGFDTAWLAELHFFTPFSIMPAPLQVAVAAAQRTRRMAGAGGRPRHDRDPLSRLWRAARREP
jgi:alkanesulfonate monooxygenase SsuD/methylene tetrahydromethanopterin reductase-like flavin-dependent oxidoreductase (luciferase family)